MSARSGSIRIYRPCRVGSVPGRRRRHAHQIIWPHHASGGENYAMRRYHVIRRLSYLGVLSILSFLAVGCATRESPALTDLNRARATIDEAKQAGATQRFPEEVARLEDRHRAARGVYYACLDAEASRLAQAMIADAHALKGRLVAAPPPPPPPANRAPQAAFTGPAQLEVNMPGTFNGSSSSDPDGDRLTFQWVFGDGDTASQPTPTHQFARPGNYTVQLMVSDGRGGTDSTSRTVTVIRRVVLQETGGRVFFDFDKAVLKPAAQQQLVDVVRDMRENPQLRAEIVGHTDSIGTDQYNLGLSRRRAEAVRNYLVAQGIAAAQIQTDWKGESQPIAPNNTAQGRAQNRRVEITLRPLPMQ
jgi:outer membrane protein OmpA-like peptidoglycan-associated protein